MVYIRLGSDAQISYEIKIKIRVQNFQRAISIM